jgi:hypothetical protein
MRKFLAAAVLTALFVLPATARAGFILEGSFGKGGQVAPTPRQWEQLNLEITPGYAPSWPVLSWFRLQLGIVTDFADKSGSSTNMQLRPMVAVVPPIIPVYGRLIFAVSNLFERDGSKREFAYGGAVGVRVGIPGISFIPALGVFVEAGVLPRKRDIPKLDTATATVTSDSKFAWVIEGRAGVYLDF